MGAYAWGRVATVTLRLQLHIVTDIFRAEHSRMHTRRDRSGSCICLAAVHDLRPCLTLESNLWLSDVDLVIYEVDILLIGNDNTCSLKTKCSQSRKSFKYFETIQGSDLFRARVETELRRMSTHTINKIYSLIYFTQHDGTRDMVDLSSIYTP